LDLAQPTVSKHLKILEEAELVERRKDGLWVNYRLAEQTDLPFVTAMLESLAGWMNEEPDIIRIHKEVRSVDRLKICKQQAT